MDSLQERPDFPTLLSTVSFSTACPAIRAWLQTKKRGCRSAPLACDVNITLQQRRRIRRTAASTFVYRLAKASCDGRARVPERCHGDPRDALQSSFCSLSASQKPSSLQLARRLALISVFIGHRLPRCPPPIGLHARLPAPRSRVRLAPPLAVAKMEGCDWLPF